MGRWMRTAESASVLGDLKATRKMLSCHKLVIGNWNITSLTRKDHELVEETKRYFLILDVAGIFSTKGRSPNAVELDDGWKLFYSGSEPATCAHAGVGMLRQPASCVDEHLLYPENVEETSDVLRKVKTNELMIFLGDFNTHFGNDAVVCQGRLASMAWWCKWYW